jgi:type IV pilus biogenesis protein CpaD/CtpE
MSRHVLASDIFLVGVILVLSPSVDRSVAADVARIVVHLHAAVGAEPAIVTSTSATALEAGGGAPVVAIPVVARLRNAEAASDGATLSEFGNRAPPIIVHRDAGIGAASHIGVCHNFKVVVHASLSVWREVWAAEPAR